MIKNHLPSNINNVQVEKNILGAKIMVWDPLGMEGKTRNMLDQLGEERIAEEIL